MRKITCMVLAVLTAATFTACSKQNKTEQVSSTHPLQNLTIGVLPDVDSIPLVIAEKNGYFEKEGLQVKLQHFQSAKDRDSALQSGNLDGVVSDVLAAAFAKEGGFDVKITSKTDGSYKLLVGKNSGINTISDMKGKSVAISTNTLIEYATDRILEDSKMSPKDINKQAIPQIPVRLEMLQNGKVDAATLPEPLASSAIKNGAKALNSTDKMGINPGVMIFMTKSIKDKQREIKALYIAYNKAVEYLSKEPVSSYADTLVKESGVPEDIKDSIILPKYTKAVMVDEKNVTPVIDWLKGKNLIKNDYKYKDLIDDTFVGHKD